MAAKPIPTSHKNRKCKSEGCKKVLSIYNHSDRCHAHLNKATLAADFVIAEK